MNAVPPTPTILLTNDDGLQPPNTLLLPLASQLHSLGHDVTVVAPSKDNSACGQRITMSHSLKLNRETQHDFPVYTLSGTPADCVIVAIDQRQGLLKRLNKIPTFCVSGINVGPNLGNDVLYSGTFAAARQAAMYGIPALAASYDEWEVGEGSERATQIVTRMVQELLKELEGVRLDVGRNTLLDGKEHDDNGVYRSGLKNAFKKGDVVLNVNIPKGWNGRVEMVRLGCILYQDGVKWESQEKDGGQLVIGPATERRLDRGSADWKVVQEGGVSISAVSTWPRPHPLAVEEEILAERWKELQEVGDNCRVENKLGDAVRAT